MRRNPSYRDRLAKSCVVACFSALLALGGVADVRGQVPGPESFIPEPKTPQELWNAADYLVRTGQPSHALPFLDKFIKSRPDDAALVEIRDRYGVGSVLRLDDFPETRKLAKPLNDMFAAAVLRNSTRTDRIDRFIAALTKTRHEQDYAVERLRESGPYAVPALVKALDQPGISATDRALITVNIGRLGRSVVPPLIATLDSTDPKLVADVADALGAIGDPRAVSDLTYLAALSVDDSPAKEAARRAVERITGRSFESQPKSPVHLLVGQARKFHLHAVEFPGDLVRVWSWSEARKLPEAHEVTKSEAEAYFGLRLARQALRLDPSSVPAQVVFVSLALDKAVERAGFANFPASDPTNAYATALASGPAILGQVLRTAIADGKTDLAAASATALGHVTDRDVLANGRGLHPLVEALSAPSRRVQFAAARALVRLEPPRRFAGSSLLVPVLGRFLTGHSAPKAIVIDGNNARGGRLVGDLNALGYESLLAPTGDKGFRAAADSADVELILVDPHSIEGSWRLVDTLSNLRSDARTSEIPTYVVGPLKMEVDLAPTLANFPGVKFVVTPPNAASLERQIGGRPSGLSPEARAAYAQEAGALLAEIAARPGSPFEPDLARVEPALAFALNAPSTSLSISSTLGDVPDAGAQRGLADVLLDPSKPAPLRLNSAAQLARSLQRFGPLVTADQEVALAVALDRERDPALRAGLASVVGALRPKSAPVGARLRGYELPLVNVPVPAAPAAPAPESAPSPPAPAEGTPNAEAVPPPADAKP